MVIHFFANVTSQDSAIMPTRAKKILSAKAVFTRYHERNMVGTTIAYAIGIPKRRRRASRSSTGKNIKPNPNINAMLQTSFLGVPATTQRSGCGGERKGKEMK